MCSNFCSQTVKEVQDDVFCVTHRVLPNGQYRIEGAVGGAKAIGKEAIRAVHSYSHPGVEQTVELLGQWYFFNDVTPAKLKEIVMGVVPRRDVCCICKPPSKLAPGNSTFLPHTMVELPPCKADAEIYYACLVVVDHVM